MKHKTNYSKTIHLLAAVGNLVCFFLPWVKWKGISVSGYYMATGKFFTISGKNFGLTNPFPQVNFAFYAFWLIPVLSIAAIIRTLQNKNDGWLALPASALSLCLVTVFYLFTGTLTDLGVGSKPILMMLLPAGIAVICAVLLLVTAETPHSWLKKAVWTIAGPVFAWLGFMLVERTVWNETFSSMKKVKADYSLNARSLLHEFEANDSAANNKYREKIIEVSGRANTVEQLKDSTVNIKFSDSTGSYLIFSFDKQQYTEVKNIREGDSVIAKGSCSGSIHSEILGTSSISFKRSTLNKK
jgi:hypothetical protein